MKENLGRRFYRYSNRMFGIAQGLAGVKDGRQRPTHPLDRLLWTKIMGIATAIPSFNQLEEAIRHGEFDAVGGRLRPTADTFPRAFRVLDLDGLKAVNDAIVEKARRNKALDDVRVEGYRVVAVDGTGCFSTSSERLGRDAHRHRVGDDPHEPEKPREAKEEAQEAKENGTAGDAYYLEKALAVSYVGGEGATVMLALERIPKGEGETTVAVKVLRELFQRHWRYCDFVTLDSGFAGAPVLNEILRQKKEFVVRVKQEKYDIIKDADGLFRGQPAHEFHKDVQLRQEHVRYDVKIWDEEDFTSWETVKGRLRCLKVEETQRKLNAAGEVVESKRVVTHFVTSAPKAAVPALTIWKIAHSRWDVENTGFHFLKHHLELEHAYSYNPKVIRVMLTLFAIAFNLLMLFIHRNLRTFQPKRDTYRGVIRRLYGGLVVWAAGMGTAAVGRPT